MRISKLSLLMIALVFAMSISGCVIIPKPTVSKYFETITASPVTVMDDGEYKHCMEISLKPVQKLPERIYLETHFANPADEQKPIIVGLRPAHNDEKISITSPFINSLKRNSNYFIEVFIYDGPTKKSLLDVHRQNIFVSFPEDKTSMVLEPWQPNFYLPNIYVNSAKRLKNMQYIDYIVSEKKEGEKNKVWIERVSSGIYSDPQPVSEFFENYIKFIQESGCDLKEWNIIKEDNNNIIYELNIEKSQDTTRLGEVGRFYNYKNKIYILIYTGVSDVYENKKDKWIKIIENSRLK